MTRPRLDDRQVSRQHALIQRTADGYFIGDQGSGNGTFVNGTPAVQPRLLQLGDVIQLGETQLQVQATGQPVAPATVPSMVRLTPEAERGGCLTFRVLLYLAGWFVFWTVISAVVYRFVKEPAAFAGVGLAALVSLILLLVNLSSHWQGQIVDLRSEQVRVTDSDGDSSFEMQQLAVIRLSSGRIRKLRALPGWQVGDWLEKRRGEGSVRVRRAGS
jgi:pSer/pThr/pTyr-binding forkhead associated (FHA) protein